MADVLIVEDDVDIASGIAEFLGNRGHTLDFAYNGTQALAQLDDDVYDLVLLDLNLPQLDGLEVCRSLQQEKLSRIPVIIMTARGRTADVLLGFESGAWDYLVKPFSFAELAARVDVALATEATDQEDDITVGDVTLSRDSLSLSYGGAGLQLHRTGFDIMYLLLKHAPRAVKTSTLNRQIWGEHMPDSNPLRAHIYRLRRQLKDNFDLDLIETVKGVGYRIGIDA